MRLLVWLIVVIGVFAGGQLPGQAMGEKKSPLVGTWVVIAAGREGKTPSGGHWEISEDGIALYRSNSVFDGRMSYKVDAGKEPKTIDLVCDRGPFKGKTLKGIYILDGDKLQICYGFPTSDLPDGIERPKQQGAKGTVTFVFERQKP